MPPSVCAGNWYGPIHAGILLLVLATVSAIAGAMSWQRRWRLLIWHNSPLLRFEPNREQQTTSSSDDTHSSTHPTVSVCILQDSPSPGSPGPEAAATPGITLYALAVLVVLLARLPIDASLGPLFFGDPAAALVGRALATAQAQGACRSPHFPDPTHRRPGPSAVAQTQAWPM